MKTLKNFDAQSFWLSNFKCQASVSADDFFSALSEVCQINRISEFYNSQLQKYQQIAQTNNFVISLTENASEIERLVEEVVL